MDSLDFTKARNPDYLSPLANKIHEVWREYRGVSILYLSDTSSENEACSFEPGIMKVLTKNHLINNRNGSFKGEYSLNYSPNHIKLGISLVRTASDIEPMREEFGTYKFTDIFLEFDLI